MLDISTSVQQKNVARIQGSIVALVTPMQDDGRIDLSALRRLMDWHIECGSDGLVIAGTTGESPTISIEENCELVREAVEYSKGRIPIIAGTGANSTAEAIMMTKYASEVGADAALLVVPYYNRPTQEGIYQHFKAIAQAADIPIILYNVPGRTVADMSTETVLRLAQIPNIAGLKDATGDIGRCLALLRQAPRTFAVYSGDDMTAMAAMFCGARGNISVTANIEPATMRELCAAAMTGRIAEAREINDRVMPLHQRLFLEANPIPVKWALAELGRIGPTLRLPLVALSAQFHETIRAALVDLATPTAQ